MVFNVTYYSELHIALAFSINLKFYQIKMLVFCNVEQPIWPLLV